MCFRAIFHCRSSQAGIIKLEWRVEVNLWTKPEVRDNFTTTGTPKVVVSSHGSSEVKFVSLAVLWWILGPSKAILARFNLQRTQRVAYFTSWSLWFDTYKNSSKWRWRDFHFAVVSKLPRMQLGRQRGKQSLSKVAQVKWLIARLAVGVTGKSEDKCLVICFKVFCNLNLNRVSEGKENG